ncbi:transposase [Streptomyces lasalocidi]
MHRFPCADRLCSWAGLTPRHYESDTIVRRGHVTKQGSKLVRWAVVEAIRRPTTSKIAEDRARIEARRGRNIAKVAAARKLLRWSPTGCATDTSAPWPARRREQPGGGRRAAGQLSGPLNGAAVDLIGPVCPTSYRSMRPSAAKE